jgi:hypothetical protein
MLIKVALFLTLCMLAVSATGDRTRRDQKFARTCTMDTQAAPDTLYFVERLDSMPSLPHGENARADIHFPWQAPLVYRKVRYAPYPYPVRLRTRNVQLGDTTGVSYVVRIGSYRGASIYAEPVERDSRPETLYARVSVAECLYMAYHSHN